MRHQLKNQEDEEQIPEKCLSRKVLTPLAHPDQHLLHPFHHHILPCRSQPHLDVRVRSTYRQWKTSRLDRDTNMKELVRFSRLRQTSITTHIQSQSLFSLEENAKERTWIEIVFKGFFTFGRKFQNQILIFRVPINLCFFRFRIVHQRIFIEFLWCT